MENYFNIILLKDGTIRTIGQNSNAQCGTGSTSTIQSTWFNPGFTNVKQVSCGWYHSAVLLNDGTVRLVGSNNTGQCATGATSGTPQLIWFNPGLTGVKEVACGDSHTLFLLNDGTVKAVGMNNYGQCGTGNTTSPQLSIYTIPGLTNVKQMACGWYHNIFLLKDGTTRTLGMNSNGQCATGSVSTSQLTVYNPGLTNVKHVACGAFHSIFVLNDGTVRLIGQNQYGQCGNGIAVPTNPYQMTTLYNPGLTNVKQAAAGQYHSVFVLNDGTVKTVGQNTYGQCGTGNTVTPQLTMYTIPDLNNVIQVACGSYHNVFLLSDGTIRTQGQNSSGQCGTGSTTPANQLTLYNPNLNTAQALYDFPLMQIIKYLIRQNNIYYSIKSAYYDDAANTFAPLLLTGGSIPNTSDIELFGFDSLSDLNNSLTISEETFKPIDKLLKSFEIKTYASKQ